jgi:hypothetical protein
VANENIPQIIVRRESGAIDAVQLFREIRRVVRAHWKTTAGREVDPMAVRRLAHDDVFAEHPGELDELMVTYIDGEKVEQIARAAHLGEHPLALDGRVFDCSIDPHDPHPFLWRALQGGQLAERERRCSVAHARVRPNIG